MSDEVLYAVRDRVATITLDRPQTRNALTQAGLDRLAAYIGEAAADDAVWVVSLRGRGPDFCIGMDTTNFGRRDEPGDFFAPVLKALDQCMKPVVCAARGEMRGGGAGVVLGSDIRILARDARIGWIHARLGICSISGPATLARAVPKNIAYEMMFTCDYLTAERAYALGVANRLADAADVDAVADEVVARVLANAPLATRAMKRATEATLGLPYGEAVTHARELLGSLIDTEDAQEGLKAHREGRAPAWKGR